MDYVSDVGGAFCGYGNAFIGTVTSPYHLYKYFSANGVSWCSTKNLFVGGFHSFMDGLTSGDPQHFGESFGTVLIAVGSAGAGFAEAPVGVAGVGSSGQTLMRVVGAEEAEIISRTGGLIESTSWAPGNGMTRVFAPRDINMMLRGLPDTTHVIEFSVRPGWQHIITDHPGWIVDVNHINSMMIGTPRVWPLP